MRAAGLTMTIIGGLILPLSPSWLLFVPAGVEGGTNGGVSQAYLFSSILGAVFWTPLVVSIVLLIAGIGFIRAANEEEKSSREDDQNRSSS